MHTRVPIIKPTFLAPVSFSERSYANLRIFISTKNVRKIANSEDVFSKSQFSMGLFISKMEKKVLESVKSGLSYELNFIHQTCYFELYLRYLHKFKDLIFFRLIENHIKQQ